MTRLRLVGLRLAGPGLVGLRLTGRGLVSLRLAYPRLACRGLVGHRLTGRGPVDLRLTSPRLTGGHLGRSHGRAGGLGRPGRTSLPARNRLAQLRQGGPKQGRLRPAGSDLARLRQARLRETGPRETGLQETGLQETGPRETGRRETGLQETGLQKGRPPGQASPLPVALRPPCRAGSPAAVMLGRPLLPRRAQVIRV